MTQPDCIVAILRFALNSVFASLTMDPGRDVAELKSEREAAAAMLAELGPRDATEAALAARAVTAHHAAMECFRRAASPDGPAALMTRLFASGMALSRMSVQLIKALEQRKGSVRRGTSVDPSGAVPPAQSAGQRRAGTAASQTAGGGQHSMPSEEAPCGSPAVKPALNRQERRRAAKQAAREVRAQETQRRAANRQSEVAA